MYIDNFNEVLPRLFYGYIGIFIVTAVIILVTVILNKVTEKK